MLDNKAGRNPVLFCFWCGISSDQAQAEGIPMKRSPTAQPYTKKSAAICENCIKDVHSQLKRANPHHFRSTEPELEEDNDQGITPLQIFNRFNDYVVGQEKAKRQLAIAIANHFHRIKDVTIQKSNILMIGPTGSGKTELARAASKILDLPFVIADATTFTAHGYVGEDVESILTRLLLAADMNLEDAQRGIVFIDEVDKLADNRGPNGGFVGTLAVQQSLLKMVEGTTVNISKHLKGKADGGVPEQVTFDTSKVLFICAGAFSGLEDIVKSDNKKVSQMGISSNPISKDISETEVIKNITPKHLIQYGLIPEFLGRFQVIAKTNPLTVKDLELILTEPTNSLISQYKRLLQKHQLNVEFSPEFLTSVAQEASMNGTGARGLKSILEERLEDLFFTSGKASKEKTRL